MNVKQLSPSLYDHRYNKFIAACGDADPEDVAAVAPDLPKSNPVFRAFERLLDAAIDAGVECDDLLKRLSGHPDSRGPGASPGGRSRRDGPS